MAVNYFSPQMFHWNWLCLFDTDEWERNYL